MINKRKAIIYIGFGELYVVMALLSIKTLRKIDKETKVYLITNINFDPINIEYWIKDRDKILYFPDASTNWFTVVEVALNSFCGLPSNTANLPVPNNSINLLNSPCQRIAREREHASTTASINFDVNGRYAYL